MTERAVIVDDAAAELRAMATKVCELKLKRFEEWQAEKSESRHVFQGMWLGLADAERMLHAKADELDPRSDGGEP